MRWLIFTINLFLMINGLSAIAKQEKIIKKPLGLKPVKNTKTLLDEFKQHLPPDDAEFLKQIDKQFKLHGDKLKIKLERENATKAYNKNAKRTIDDSLGYSYQQNMHNNGYYFSRPIYMHKFTSQDVPTEKGYNEKATDIEVQQSHSYEIKGEASYNQYQGSNTQQSFQNQQVYEDPVPVIVLRVPGPPKYALHLQALLQQYLELRAAQFLKVLEEQDRQGNLHSGQGYQAQDQMQYVPMIAVPMYHSYYQQQPQQQVVRYRQHYQQPTAYHRIPAGEQSYYRGHQMMQHHYTQQSSHYPKYVQQIYHAPQQPQKQQQIVSTSYVTYVTPSYSETHEQSHDDHEPLQTSENYPSDKHTQVIFKKRKNRINHPQPTISYHQPGPIVVPDTHEEYNQQEEQVVVTHKPVYEERTKPPFNYHVANPTLAPTPEELHERINPKRMAPFTREQFEKARRIMDKSKRSRGASKAENTTDKSENKS